MELIMKIRTEDKEVADAIVKKMLSALDVIELGKIEACDLHG